MQKETQLKRTKQDIEAIQILRFFQTKSLENLCKIQFFSIILTVLIEQTMLHTHSDFLIDNVPTSWFANSGFVN